MAKPPRVWTAALHLRRCRLGEGDADRRPRALQQPRHPVDQGLVLPEPALALTAGDQRIGCGLLRAMPLPLPVQNLVIVALVIATPKTTPAPVPDDRSHWGST
jgi:hypothetical protein